MAIVYLGIGSNQGNRYQYIQKALCLLEAEGIVIQKISSIIETTPVGGPPQDDFLNAVLKIATSLTPQELLKVLKKIEHNLGREKTVCNGPRPMDLDILLYDHLKLQTPLLTIPHPRMWRRAFVVNPLKEIYPNCQNHFTHACC